ncbi:hypothetical protein PoMZ_13338 [Pyricularia oryzae]|uniref:Uncharacterized protein n=1 Tax=Pyricularia oryzae TaxID=318829 RepID=A0A4P7NV60_PYROR|nr:hypothetical protein PoMZ_13338 [Pyricularia oryzae]
MDNSSTLATWIDLMTQNSWIIRCGNPAQSPRFVKDERECPVKSSQVQSSPVKSSQVQNPEMGGL